MTSLLRIWLSATTAVVVAALTLSAMPAHAALVARIHEVFTPVVGSESYLVYGVQPVQADGNAAGKTRIYARRVDGKTRELGRSDVPQRIGSDVVLHSVVGHWLVGRQVQTRYAAWWNLANGRHGRLRLPRHVDLLTAVPGGGVTYMSRDGRVHEEKLNGTRRVLGRPFAAEPGDYRTSAGPLGSVLLSSADGHGIVLGGADDGNGDNAAGVVDYIEFAHPGVVRRLHDPIGDAQLCGAVSAAYAACVALVPERDWSGDDPEGVGIGLVPLDGTTPTAAAGVAMPVVQLKDGLGVHGGRVIWAAIGANPQATLTSLDAGASTIRTSSTVTDFHATAAYGGLVVATTSQRGMIFATSADHWRPLG